MKNQILAIISTSCLLAGWFCPKTEGANLTTTNIQAAGANWTAAIWKTNTTGLATNTVAGIAPVAGNTYETVFNGISTVGNALNNTRIRCPQVVGLQTFPGDSLTLNTNTELRLKNNGAGAGGNQAALNSVNFPGVGGTPGLILNGGLIDGGDDGVYPMLGSIFVRNQSYISHGNGGGGGGFAANRALNITGVLSGSANLVIMNAGLTLPQQVSGTANTFSGQWIVQCGWLQGVTAGSLGTNNITVDPAYTGFNVAMPLATSPVGPAQFEVNYDINSAGTLTLMNGGTMRLHQNCVFNSVVIEGTSLAPGTHLYGELTTTYPANFPAGGSGSITVRPYSLTPLVVLQPQSQFVYIGAAAHFNVGATVNAPFTYQWRKNGSPLSDIGNISGSTTARLTVSGVSSADLGNYDVLVSNGAGPTTTAAATITLLSPSEAYETAVATAQPYAFYQFNETTDPSANSAVAFDNAGGFNGLYGGGVQNGFGGVTGPTVADGFPGFSAANKAAAFTVGTGASRITVPQWSLNTNTVTLAAWVKPAGAQNPACAIAFCRGGDTVAGLQYTGGSDLNGNPVVGYTWNNEPETYGWNSGVGTPVGIWSFVALVVTPTNVTIHVMSTNGLTSATRTYAHVVQSFNGTTLIGDDSNDGGNGARVFNGAIDDIAVFNRALSKSDLFTLFSTASGVSSYTPIITAQPAPLNLYAGQTAQFTVSAGGSEPLTFQWQQGPAGGGVYANVTDAGRISGSSSSTLTISNLVSGDTADYVVVIANSSGSVTSTVANLSVQPTGAAQNITLAIQQAAGADWDTPSAWSDSNPASVSAAAFPGSTYELLAGSRLRSPAGLTVATFPGNVLTLDGNAVWSNNPALGAPICEIRFKQPAPSVGNGVVNFRKLVMNGGQLDLGSPGTVTVGGEIDILTNAPIYNDSAADEGYLINAWLTGGGKTSIEYHGYSIPSFQSAFVNNLNIAGTSNAYSGKWNVVVGTLLGTGPNSLGTNDITIAAQGALETTYDVNNPSGNLFLNGRMYLHQADTFRSLFVNGTPLNPGTYTFAQLNTLYPANFPATWTPQTGATNFTTGSGSITVLIQPAPTITQQPASLTLYPNQTASFTVQAQGNPPLGYRWRKNNANLSDNANLTGSTTTNLVIPLVGASDAGNYTVVVTNSVGSVTSVVASLTVLPAGPPLNLTLDYGGVPIPQAAGFDWNTPTNWSDGQPAALSVFSNPGSTYEVVVGSRLRPPAGTNYAVFPGNLLKLDGSGVLENSTLNAVGEFRFKHPDPGTNYFKKLVLNGGQLDNGDNGTIVVQGELDVVADTPMYVDTAAGVDRTTQIDAWLTGSANIFWSQWGAGLGGPDLNITGTSNTFSGKWNVLQGTLLGSGTNSLGTNDLIVSATGALETLYDINDQAGSLVLDGQMFLHQNDTFKNVTVAGTPLASGTYTFAQLNSTYLANFPATWAVQNGSTVNAGSGSITVIGNAPPPVTIGFSASRGNMTLTWSQGTLLEATNVYGPWVTNGAASPYTVVPTGPQKFFRVQTQ